MSNRHESGGIWALAGFLYQITGMLSLTTQIIETSSLNSTQDLIEVLLSLSNVGPTLAVHEYLGQDVAFVNHDDDTVLIQFKYSVTHRTISRGELREIINKLDQSAQRARNRHLNITACVLITNRRFTQGHNSAVQLWDKEQERPRDYALRYVTNSIESWEHNLRDFGRKLCALDHEIKRGIDILIGKVVRDTGSQLPRVVITIEDIKEAILGEGEREAIPLTLESARRYSSRNLEDIRQGLGLTGQPIHRDRLNELGRACNERAIVVLHGKGGCGKTVLLWQWVQENNKLFDFKTLQEVRQNWITREMCDWITLSSVHSWRQTIDFEGAIARIQRARPDLNLPLVHLALDGLDELCNTHQREEIVRDIIRWFWKEEKNLERENRPPRAVLVVSCRNIKDFIRKWLPITDLSGFKQDYNEIPNISVSEFSDEELSNALKTSAIDREIRESIEQSLGSENLSEIRMGSYSNFGLSAYQTRYVDRDLIDAIHHPVVWTAFLQLERSIQENLINGDRDSFLQLAHSIVERFCRKVVLRRRIINIGEELLLEILKDIEQFYKGDINLWRKYQDWIRPISENGRLEGNANAAGILYDEAFSDGLINEQSPRMWQWSYTWIRDYLVSGSER